MRRTLQPFCNIVFNKQQDALWPTKSSYSPTLVFAFVVDSISLRRQGYSSVVHSYPRSLKRLMPSLQTTSSSSIDNEATNNDVSPISRSHYHRGDDSCSAEENFGVQDFADFTAQQNAFLQRSRAPNLHSKDNYRKFSSDDEPPRSQPRSLIPRPSSIALRASSIDQDEAPPTSTPASKADPVSWGSLPKKRQLTILTLARLSGPLI